MSEPALHFSIDLEAELRKISMEQHLNQVHYLVQLVRHALRHRPLNIQIHSRRCFLEFVQDGRGLDDEEWALLQVLLDRPGTPASLVQRALSRLEEHFGVAVLSLVMRASWVEIATGSRRLISETGRVSFLDGQPDVPGYRIRLKHHRESRRQELSELAFFCGWTTASIFYNRKRINSSPRLSGLIASARFNFRPGSGVIGIPAKGELSIFHYFKQGVRFGLRQFRINEGQVIRGYWDSKVVEHESNFQRSIQAGYFCLRAHAELPYKISLNQFNSLPIEQKARLKRILLGIPRGHWRAGWADLPLFHSPDSQFAISLRVLVCLRDRFGVIPYRPRGSSKTESILPVLSPEDVHFLRNEMGLALQVAALSAGVNFRRSLCRWLRWLPWSKSRRRPLPPLPFDRLSPFQQAFLKALSADDDSGRFSFVDGRQGRVEYERTYRRVLLPLRHSRVECAIKTWLQQPELLPLLRGRLLGLVSQR